MKNKSKVRVYALAFLAKIPDADPAMPIYLGLDDITFKGAREIPFHFVEPIMYKLPEFKPYIPQKHYDTGNIFELSGYWHLNARKVTLQITSYVNRKNILYSGELYKEKNKWKSKRIILSFPNGIYLGKLIAYKDNKELSETEFTIHIAPKNIGGDHPRLLFNSEKLMQIKEHLKNKAFTTVNDSIMVRSIRLRNETPLNSLVFDLDQFPDKNWLPSWDEFGAHIYNTGPALEWNAFAFAFDKDTIAGEYVKNVLVKLSKWPIWTSPWLIRHGIYDDHRMGTWSTNVALAYDLTYNIMSPNERTLIRKA
ncbi:MAG: hypothetical protein ACRDE2_17580, partial [Chitinophagaceae bacterium]